MDTGTLDLVISTGKNYALNIIAHTTEEVFSTFEKQWNKLLYQSTFNIIFNTVQWHRNWWAAYHPGDLWVLTLQDDMDELLGIASFFITEESGKRVLHFVGCEDVTDYLDLIIHRDHADVVYQALAEYLAENHHVFDVIDLCNIPDASPTRTLFADAMEHYGFDVLMSQMEVCPVIHLEGGWDTYLDNLDKKQRHELRRKLRKADAQKDQGTLSWYIVDESHNLQEEMAKFLDLMAKSQENKAQFLKEEAHINFFNRVVPDLFEAGWVKMSFLTIDEEPITTYLNFDYNNRILVYNSGLDASSYGYLSPGIVLLSYNIQHALDAGRELFDFLRGDETYKYRMGAQDTSVFNLKATLN